MNHENTMARDEAFARWYRAHHSRIRALCTRILRDASMAEDIAQESLLRAWERHHDLREEDLGAWLSVVARNLCISALRRDQKLVSIDPLPDRADPASDPATLAERRETRRNVRRALSKLGERNRRVLYLHEVAEVDYEEIGEDVGLTAEGARSIAFRARRALREHLVAAGEGFGAWVLGVRVRIRNLSTRLRNAIVDPSASNVLQSGIGVALAASLILSPGSIDGLRSVPSDLRRATSVAAAPGTSTTSALAAPSTSFSHGSNGVDDVVRSPGDLPGPIEGGRPVLDRPDDELHWWMALDDPITGEGGIGINVHGEGDNQIVFPAIDSTFMFMCEAEPDSCEQLDRILAGGE